MSNPVPRYISCRALDYAYWPDELAGVVYNLRSGDTHKVNLVGLHILQHFVIEPLTLAQVCSSIAQAFGLEQNPELEEQLRQLLHGLVQQGLVKRYLF